MSGVHVGLQGELKQPHSWLLVTALFPVTWVTRTGGSPSFHVAWRLGAALFPVTLGHSARGVFQLPRFSFHSLLPFLLALLHSEFLWPCFCSLGCMSQASAWFYADESEVATRVQGFFGSSFVFLVWGEGMYAGLRLAYVVAAGLLHSEYLWPCFCSLGCLHRASAWCCAAESGVAAWIRGFFAALAEGLYIYIYI